MSKEPSIIDSQKDYNIEEVALFTGYSTGYIRKLEKDKKIPTANRDSKGWRYWKGEDVIRIIKYKNNHLPSAGLTDQ